MELDFSHIDRRYESARQTYKPNIPEHFNFAFDVIDAKAKREDAVAIIAVSRDGEDVSEIRYSQVSDRSNRFATALSELGLKKGDYALIVMGRVPEWYYALFGCMKVGVVAMPGTNLLTARDLAFRINHAKAKAVIVSADHCEKIEDIKEQCPTLENLIVVGEERAGWQNFDALCEGVRNQMSKHSGAKTQSSDTMMAYFTSGTTSNPKMVLRDHGYALAHAATGLFWLDHQKGDVHWTLTDTGWAKAAWGMLFPQFLLGVSVVLYDGAAFDADLHLRLIEKLSVNTFCAPPTVYRLFAQMDLSRYDFSSIRRSLGSGEPLNPEVIRTWKKATGTVIADGYGQTESINLIANYPDQEVRIGSMGLPVPGFDIDVIDDDGNRLPPGEIGHIAVNISGDWPPGLFTGYRTGEGEPLDTSSFRNGWYYTGDTARRDDDGYFWFVGRADDVILSAGYRISPFEVESTLLEHGAVAESAVIGTPDETRGQIVKAFVVLAEGYEANDELITELQDFCKRATAPYKYPREIVFLESLPKTVSGKIRRVELRNA